MDIEQLKAELKTYVTAARRIADLVEKEGRDFTKQEREEVESYLAKARLVQDRIEKADPEGAKARQKKQDEYILNFIHELEGGSQPGGGPVKFGAWSKAFMDALPYQPGSGRKDLLPVSGSVSVGQLSSTIGTLDDEGRVETVLQIIPREPATGDAFSYLRETVRQHMARPVAIGERKPQSTYTLERVDDRIRTIAHLSEPISKNWLSDAPMLRGYLDNVLRAGVLLEVEFQILQGSGVDEDLPGILNQSGVLVQVFDSDILTTTRKAVTLLENRPVTPTAWIFNPTDWETVELSKASGSGEFLVDGSPVDRARRRLWGLPVALTLGIPEGTALVADWRSAVSLMEREGTVVDWSEAFHIGAGSYDEEDSTGFQTNQVQFRAEGRWGMSVNRPGAICEVDLSSGS